MPLAQSSNFLPWLIWPASPGPCPAHHFWLNLHHSQPGPLHCNRVKPHAVSHLHQLSSKPSTLKYVSPAAWIFCCFSPYPHTWAWIISTWYSCISRNITAPQKLTVTHIFDYLPHSISIRVHFIPCFLHFIIAF